MEFLTPHLQLQQQVESVKKTLNGYWAADIWNILECPVYDSEPLSFKSRNIHFRIFSNHNIRSEMKYFLSSRLQNNHYTYLTVWDGYAGNIQNLGKFLSLKYPNALSIVDINKEKALLEYRTFLSEAGIKTSILSKNNIGTKSYNKASRDIVIFNQFYDFFVDYYDEREEIEKDVWDIRNLSVEFNEARGEYIISFEKIPQPHRTWVKKYTDLRLNTQQNLSFSRIRSMIPTLSRFFTFIKEVHPDWENLKDLSREDILDFIKYLRTLPIVGNSKKPVDIQLKNRVRVYLYDVQAYISYIQKLEWEYAPIRPVTNLILQEDMPKKEPMKATNIKFIPDDVWEQILNNLAYLNPYYVPILLVLEASGFRISDTLLLRKDCIEEAKDGWWLIGDQRKVNYTNHRVPITNEIVAVIKSQIQFLDSKGDSSFNPKGYLFPNLSGRRKSFPISAKVFNDNLNLLAQKRVIRDSSGEIYHIKNHAFRHRYGVNMINNGMNILYLQKLLAHASPEMTLIYAQIHDNTLRSEWEKARSKGAVMLSNEGNIIEADIEAQAEENGLELEWIRHNLDSIRLDHGFCIKSPKLSCNFLDQTLEPPCIKNNCRSFHTDLTFLDYYKDQVSKMESDIEIYKKSNRLRSIELLQPKLNRYYDIVSSLEQGENIYGLNKARREYNNDEKRRGYEDGKPTA